MATLLVARRGDPGGRGRKRPANPDSERYETGAPAPGPDAILAGPTFEEWLEATPPSKEGA